MSHKVLNSHNLQVLTSAVQFVFKRLSEFSSVLRASKNPAVLLLQKIIMCNDLQSPSILILPPAFWRPQPPPGHPRFDSPTTCNFSMSPICRKSHKFTCLVHSYCFCVYISLLSYNFLLST